MFRVRGVGVLYVDVSFALFFALFVCVLGWWGWVWFGLDGVLVVRGAGVNEIPDCCFKRDMTCLMWTTMGMGIFTLNS